MGSGAGKGLAHVRDVLAEHDARLIEEELSESNSYEEEESHQTGKLIIDPILKEVLSDGKGNLKTMDTKKVLAEIDRRIIERHVEDIEGGDSPRERRHPASYRFWSPSQERTVLR
eukprot:TRINITY_DN115149_c0_g1_i1.p1 TRINITY_DN115149_c0_g1~~TRINITY_DN115149_c0_g1_i1.p1  ORF type:complete len:115 (+),score=25.03 TRINITY_DN115149_c0_g1_i1:49-393(+)